MKEKGTALKPALTVAHNGVFETIGIPMELDEIAMGTKDVTISRSTQQTTNKQRVEG